MSELENLKAEAYDCITVLEQTRKRLDQLNLEIFKKIEAEKTAEKP